MQRDMQWDVTCCPVTSASLLRYSLLSFWKKKESEGRPIPGSKTSGPFADLSDRSQAALRDKIGIEEHFLSGEIKT
jgi:hypothetical protein